MIHPIRAIDEHMTFGGEWRPHPTNPDKWIFWRREYLNGPLIRTVRAFIGTPPLQRSVDCPKT